jgi:hypothetical protein
MGCAGLCVSERDADTTQTTPPLMGGQLLAAISNSIVGILREHYGRGPMKAKTYALDDIIVVVMRAAALPRSSRRSWTAGSRAAWSTCGMTFSG